MIDQRIARRYGKAIFELALEGDNLEGLSKEFDDLLVVLEENETLKKLFMEAHYVADEIKGAVASIFKENSELFLSFLGILIEKRRTAYINAIIEVYRELKEAHFGYASATVTTAFPLEEEELARIKASLEKEFNKKMKLEVVLDKSLIAGIRIQYGDYVLDTSYQAKLANLATKLRSKELEVTGTNEH